MILFGDMLSLRFLQDILAETSHQPMEMGPSSAEILSKRHSHPSAIHTEVAGEARAISMDESGKLM